MDIIFVRELRVETLIGIYAWEKQAPQALQLDLEIGLPDSRPCTSDDINDALDYADVVRRIRQMLAERHFNLLEALAEQIARLLIDDFRSPWVRVSVAKLQAIRDCRMVGITIERSA